MKKSSVFLLLSVFSFLSFSSDAQTLKEFVAADFSLKDHCMIFIGEDSTVKVIHDFSRSIYIHASDPSEGFVVEIGDKGDFKATRTIRFRGEESGEIYTKIANILINRSSISGNGETGYIGYY